MDIVIAEQCARMFNDQLDAQTARERAIEKKLDAFGTVAKFLQRPKPEEIQIIYSEKRYEPFWCVVAKATYVYERAQKYRVPVQGAMVKQVIINGETYVPQKERDSFALTVQGMERCEESTEKQVYVDGVTSEKKDFSAYLKYAATDIPSLDTFAPEGVLVVPPQVRIAQVVREVLTSLMKAVQADKIIEERIEVSQVVLYFRPVYAFEYHWTVKDKKQTLEFDGLTGALKSDGKAVREVLKKMMDSDTLFDVSGEALNLLLPGGSVAVKLARAAAQRGLKN
jgi:hypothetical protein